MKKLVLRSALLVLAGTGLVAGSAFGTPVNVTGENSEQTLNQIFASNNWLIDANANQTIVDQYWKVDQSLFSGAWAGMVIEIAGNSAINTFGMYDPNGHWLTLMDGSASAGDKVEISFGAGNVYATFKDYNGIGGALISSTDLAPMAMASTFGFFLGGTAGPIFYSDQALNADLTDHMVSYAGTPTNGLSAGHYILAFEDTLSTAPGYDWDYNDMVIMVESVSPVPEPATMLLFGTGLIGLAGVARKRKNK